MDPFPIMLLVVMGLCAGLILVIAAKFMAVKTDKKYEDIRAALPGVNCGACGYSGCDQYADKLAHEDDIKTNLCTPGADSVAAKISSLLGVEFEDVIELSAKVKCSGNCQVTETIMDYKGRPTCAACNSFYQGRGSCSHACLGFGDCIDVCQYDAIHIVDGIAQVDNLKCTGCGMCAKLCPNHLIMLTPLTSRVYIACSSTDKGAYTRKVCKEGCIGCKKCEKNCKYGAIKINNNLAEIDSAKCVNCGDCVKNCPTGAIKVTCGDTDILQLGINEGKEVE